MARGVAPPNDKTLVEFGRIVSRASSLIHSVIRIVCSLALHGCDAVLDAVFVNAADVPFRRYNGHVMKLLGRLVILSHSFTYSARDYPVERYLRS